MSRPNTKLIKEFYPDVEGARDLGEHDTLLSIAKARRLLGYRPAYSWCNAGTS
jgi:UDP-glucose 4-epimerase